MTTLKERMMSQFGHPSGPLGHVVGVVMAARHSNRVRNLWTVDQLDLQPADHLLEIGYGPGIGLVYAVRRATCGRVVGVDVSEVMRRQAARRNRAGLASGRVSLHVGEIDSLDVNEPFTKAMAVNVFMFWPDPVAVLRRLSAVLAPGATVALTMQPRGSAARTIGTDAVGERIAAALRTAGYGDIELRTLRLKPVDAVCVLGRHPSTR